MRDRYAIVVHGGAGKWKPDEAAAALAGVRVAAEAGHAVLTAGGSALDSVVAAVVALEDDPVFNAGTGSVLNLAGEVEMDACVMDGHGLRAGAVGALRSVKNPVLVARGVMEETDHVLLVGEGALRFARELGFPPHDPVTEERRMDHARRLAELPRDGDPHAVALRGLLARHPGLSPGTVGAVALDRSGCLAAATSTGGLTLKLPGRVGDTPLPGAGTYATDSAAASATGLGEPIMRVLATRRACDLVVQGETAATAAAGALQAIVAICDTAAGIIVVDRKGGIGVDHVTEFMPHAFCVEGDSEITARMTAERTPIR